MDVWPNVQGCGLHSTETKFWSWILLLFLLSLFTIQQSQHSNWIIILDVKWKKEKKRNNCFWNVAAAAHFSHFTIYSFVFSFIFLVFSTSYHSRFTIHKHYTSSEFAVLNTESIISTLESETKTKQQQQNHWNSTVRGYTAIQSVTQMKHKMRWLK